MVNTPPQSPSQPPDSCIQNPNPNPNPNSEDPSQDHQLSSHETQKPPSQNSVETLEPTNPDHEQQDEPQIVSDDPEQDDPEHEQEGMIINNSTSRPNHSVLVSDSKGNHPPVSSPRRGSKRKKGSGKNYRSRQVAIEKKLNVLSQNLNPIPFVPGKVLDFGRYEEFLKQLGLWEFVQIEFDRSLRTDFIAQLVANYNPKQRASYVNDKRVGVNRAVLGRALKLPGKKVGGDCDMEFPAEFLSFLEEFVSNWMLLHEELWMTPDEVLNWLEFIKSGRPEKVDWAGLIWFMVDKELAQGQNLKDCYYACHLQQLIKVQREDLFRESMKVDLTVEDDEDGTDVKMFDAENSSVGGQRSEDQIVELKLGQDSFAPEEKGDQIDKMEKGDEIDKLEKGGEVDKVEKGGEVNKVEKGGEVDEVKKGGEVDEVEKGVNVEKTEKRDESDKVEKVSDVDKEECLTDVHTVGITSEVHKAENSESAIDAASVDNTYPVEHGDGTHKHVGNVDEHVENAKEPVENAKEPVENADEPVDNADEPVDNAHEPIKIADEHVEKADEHVEKADEHLENADDRVENANEHTVNADGVDERATNADGVDEPAINVDEPDECAENTDDDADEHSGNADNLIDNADEHPENLFENADDDNKFVENDVDNSENPKDDSKDLDMMDFGYSKGDEQGQWLMDGKNDGGHHFLQPCNMTNVTASVEERRQDGVGDGIEVVDGEEDGHVEGFKIMQKVPLDGNGMPSVNLLQGFETGQLQYTSQELTNQSPLELMSCRADNNVMLGSSSLFNHAGKREMDFEHDMSHHDLNGSHKKMRIDNSWEDQKPPVYDICMEQMMYWFNRVKMSLDASKAENDQQASMNEFVAHQIEERDEVIRQLRCQMDELQRKNRMDITLRDRELYLMNSVIDGYRKALKQTEKAFTEFRELHSVPVEPIYKDAGSGGVVKSIKELEQERIKQEEETKRICLLLEDAYKQQLNVYEDKWSELLKIIDCLDHRVHMAGTEVQILKENLVKPKSLESPKNKA